MPSFRGVNAVGVKAMSEDAKSAKVDELLDEVRNSPQYPDLLNPDYSRSTCKKSETIT
jgi:hypothetical protein